MSLKEMFPAVRDLPRADKLRLMQFIAERLVYEEDTLPELQVGTTYPIWTPQGVPDSAAETLATYLASIEAIEASK